MSIAMKLNQVFTSVAGKKAPAPVKPAVESKPAETTASTSSLTSSTTKHKSGQFFEEVEAKLKTDGAGLVSKVNAIIGFQINCAGNKAISYAIDLKNGSGSVFVNDGGWYILFIFLKSTCQI